MDFNESIEYFPDDAELGLEEYTDDCVQDNEPCGICLDVVIDRGMLDSCDHWFCFACIDNWAAITNLCPICKMEFQLITCLPVYETVGNARIDDPLHSRDEDLHVEGRFNTLSFPSYYIDEDAVVCLDGHGCKIRDRAPTEEDTNIDTSIACDSCDVWYHAFCVGFDPEDTSHSSWLCPRCIKKPASRGSEKISEEDLLLENDQRNPCSFHSVGSVLSGRVSVSIADPGETAVVISLIEGNQFSGNDESLYQIETNLRTCSQQEASMLNVMPSASVFDQWGHINVMGQHSNQLLINNPETNRSPSEFSSEVSPGKVSADNPVMGYDEVENVMRSDTDSGMDIVLEIPEPKSPSRRDFDIPSSPLLNKERGGVQSPEGVQDLQAPAADCIGLKPEDDDEKSHVLPQKRQFEKCLETKTEFSALGSPSNYLESNPNPENNATLDIMSIVQSSRVDEKCGSGGLRVKKILWKSMADNKSSSLIQKLRGEIRDTVGEKNISDISKAFDGKLLSAFRAAISRSATESFDKSELKPLRARNILPQKGKVRENLTKKVYATASGRRKRAWDRDWAVEFWKHRRVGDEPEKVKTLQSVLELLKKLKSPVFNPETAQDGESQADNSLLSRLYLADTSVLPRTEGMKPLSNVADAHGKNPTEATAQNKRLKTGGSAPAKDLQNSENIITKAIREQTKHPLSSSSSKSDKRQWALEVLARKSSLSNSGTSQSSEKDQSLKGSYPLLAQLPMVMRPVPMPCSHKKIPMPVRQTQVYRLAEQYLKRVGIPIVHTAAEVELAIADAVNIEKEICERSKSKLVYVNLCSQRAVHGKDSRLKAVDLAINPTDVGTNEANGFPESTNESVEQMLRLAGLLSDSPPNSPLMAVSNREENEPAVNSCPDSFIQDESFKLENQAQVKMTLPSENCEALTKSLHAEHSPAEQISCEKCQEHSTDLSDSRIAERGSSVSSMNFSDGGKLKTMDDTRIKELDGNDCEETSLNDSQLELHSTGSQPYNLVESSKNGSPSRHSAEEITISSTSKMARDDNQIKRVEGKTREETSLHDSQIKLCGKKPIHSKGCPAHPDNPAESSKNGSPSRDSAVEITTSSISKMVEAYVKEHIRPLCKSGIITVEQYRWAVGKTTEKVMKYHSKAKNASFLIKEGDKVKKLAEEYVTSFDRRPQRPPKEVDS
ncbi:RING/U-box protein [Wolffia australiana]